MKNERITPKLCLKVNVPYALHNGERVTLASSPKNEDGKILIPKEALSLLGITAKNEYTELGTLGDINVVYEDMGLIFLDTYPDYPALNTEGDLVYILSLAHSFIFEVSVGRLARDYAPATDSEREGFVKVGEELRDKLLKRNNTHPFIFGTQEIFDKLRAIYSSDGESEIKGYISALIGRADKYLEYFPALNESGDGLVSAIPETGYGEGEYDVGGRHSHSEGRLLELAHVAFAYQMTLDERYAKLAYYCALGVIGRLHWGPGHFLNCSGATGRLVMVYDWLYNAWKALKLDTGLIRRGIYTQGLHHGYNSVINDTCDFPSPKQGTGWRFKLKNDNWNSVCNSGMIIGSLCILNDGVDESISEEEYKKVTELLGACITSTMQPQLVYTQYAPDGSYVESNSYWAYGTVNLMNSMAALYDSLGTDLGLSRGCGLDKTCYYAINTESADFVGWNYHDGGMGAQDTSSFNQFALISGDSALFSIRQNQLRAGKSITLLDMLYHPTVRGVETPELSALPLDYAMEGIDAFTVRSGWDKGSLFAGMIGGENPAGGSHNQLDSGAFVYHNLGKLWFSDLGSDYYNSRGIANGQGYFSNYALYRRNAEGNNCLCLTSLPFGQLQGKRGVMTEYSSSEGASYIIIDNSAVYGEDKVKSAKRGMLLTNGRRTLVIKDEVEFVDKETAFSTAHFESDKITAEISEGGKKATLTHSTGEKIYVTLLGDGCLEVMNCTDPLLSGTAPAEGEYSRDNYSRLVVRYEGVKSINTALVIDTDEDAGIKENISVDMWKSL
ncbi:MAG: hypothetical protein IJW53_01900 [Clostridia bacterium]|nr:hypothetical protein [Clostridia bacterium]